MDGWMDGWVGMGYVGWEVVIQLTLLGAFQ